MKNTVISKIDYHGSRIFFILLYYSSNCVIINLNILQVWDSCSDSMITFNNDDLNDNLAYIVENDVILEAVKRSFPKSHNLNIKYNTSAKSYIIPGITPGHDGLDQNSWVTVQLNDGSEMKTKLLVSICSRFVLYLHNIFHRKFTHLKRIMLIHLSV